MPIILDGTTGITTPGITNTGTFVFQGPVQVPAGSAATASITTAAGANTGIFFPSSSSVAITTAGTQRFVVSASGDVGIGTGSPQTRLEANQTGVGSVVIPIVAANQDTSSTGTGAGIGFVVDGVNDVIGAQVAGIRTGSAYHQSALTMYTRDSAGGGLLERVRVDSAGNLGLGVVPSAWTNTVKALQVNTTSALWANSSTMFLTNNTFTDGTDKYITTAAATRYYQSAGSHIWNIAPSGTAGNAITFTQAMTLDTSGNLGLGVVPSAWGSPFKVIEGGDSDNQSWIGFQSNANAVKVGVNCYYDGANYRYKYTGAAGLIGVQDNVFSFAQAASGTAGNTITFTQAMTLDASGNLGIGAGSSSPASTLDVRFAAGTTGSIVNISNGSSAAAGNIVPIRFFTGNTFGGLEQCAAIWGINPNAGTNNGGVLVFATSANGTATTPSERARIASNGDFGIGTSSPAFKLDVSAAGEVISGTATTGSNMRGIRIYNTTTATTNNAIGLWLATGPHQAGIATFRSNAGVGWDTVLAFYTHQTTTTNLDDCYERMRITGDGALLVNCTTAATNALFEVSSNGTKKSFQVYNNDNVQLYSLGTGTVYSNGGVLTNTNPSDERLKDDVADLPYGLEQVLALRPVSYKWKNDRVNQGTQYGFIAQEVQSVMPELVREFDTVENGEPVKRYGLEKDGIYGALVKAIQELKAELDALKGSN